jgi:hypothetical protein
LREADYWNCTGRATPVSEPEKSGALHRDGGLWEKLVGFSHNHFQHTEPRTEAYEEVEPTMAGLIGFSDYDVLASNQTVAPVAPPSPDLAQITNSLADGPDSMLAFNLGRDRQNDLFTQNQILQDWGTMSANDFVSRYGTDVADQVGRLFMGQAELSELQNRDRNLGQIAGDSANSIVTGLVGGFGDMATLGAAIVNDDAGRAVAGVTDDFRKYMQGLQSTEENQRRFLNGMAAQLDELDNTAAYEASIEEGNSELQATLGYLGRGFVNGVGRLFEDPLNLGTGVSEGIGSLLAGGYAGKGAKIGLAAMGRQFTRETTEDIVRESVERSAATVASRTLSDRLTMPLVIGGMEGGNAYGSAVSQVMAMSHEQLMGSSEEYRSLVSSGTEPDQAREEVAAQAGMIAAMIAAPAGAATGMLVSRFEANPFARQSVKTMTGNLGREAVEEGTQSLTGQLGTNTGLAVADNSIQPLEGAGDAAGEGAVLGSLTAGAVQSPRLAGAAVAAGFDRVAAAGQRAQDRVKSTEGITPEVMATLSASTPESIAVLEEAIATGLTGASSTSEPLGDELLSEAPAAAYEASNDTREVMNSVLASDLAEEAEVLEEFYPDLYKKIFTENAPTNQLELMVRLTELSNNENEDKETRENAALYITAMVEMLKQSGAVNITAVTQGMQADDPALSAIQEHMEKANTLVSSPAIAGAMAQVSSPDFKPSSETQNLLAAETRPDAVDVQMGNKMLMQDAADGVVLSPAKRRVLKAAIALKKIQDANKVSATAPLQTGEEVEQTGEQTDLSTDVSIQIAVTGGTLQDQHSLAQYTGLINRHMKSGNTGLARNEVRRLANFAKHMRNKLNAWNESMQTGKTVEFERLGPDFQVRPTKGRATVYKNDPNSLEMGRIVYAEAKAVHDLLREMSTIYPELKLKESSPLPALDQGFNPKGEPKKEVSRISEEQVRKLSVDRIRVRVDAIQKRIAEGQYQEGDNATLEVLMGEANRILDIDAEGRSEARRAAKAASTSPELNQQVFDQMVELVDDKGRVPLKAFDKAQRVALRYFWKVRTTSTYGYLPESLLAQVLEAKGKPAETPPADVTPTERMKARFPKLFAVGEKMATFYRAFTYKEGAKSRLQNEENILEKLRDHLKSGKPISDYVSSPGFRDNDDTRQGIGRMINATLKLRNILSARLAEALKNEALQKALEAGKDVSRFRKYRVFGIVENDNGQYRYNRELLEATAMAGIHWRMNTAYMTQGMDLEEVMEMTGLTEEEAAFELPFFQNAMLANTAITSLGQMIKEFWGVTESRDEGKGVIDGIAQNLAREVLLSMQDTTGVPKVSGLGDVQIETKTINSRTYTVVRFIDNEVGIVNHLLNHMHGENDFLADMMILDGWKKGIYIGEKPTKFDTTQIRNPNTLLTDETKKANRKLTTIPHYIDNVLLEIVERAGEKVVRLYRNGFDVVEDEDGNNSFNNQNLRSVVGKNRTVTMAFKEMVRLARRVEAHPKSEDGSPVPIYYDWGVTRGSRFQQGGTVNPESDKLHRHIFSPTWAVLDMSNPYGKDARGFWKAIAQGLGKSTHREYGTATMDSTMDRTLDPNGDLYQVVEDIAHFLRVGAQKARKEALPENFIPKIKDILKDGATEHALASLVAVAQYKNLYDAEGTDAEVKARLKAFRTSSYLEADGITNGPFMALIRYATGIFTPEWLEMVYKGGLFFGSERVSMNDYHNNGNSFSKTDIYTKVSKVTSLKLAALRAKASKPVQEHMDALVRLMAAFNVSLDLVDDTHEVTRAGAKKPVTISVYASGIDGMTKKVRAELVKALYEHMTDLNTRGGKPGNGLFYNGVEYDPAQFAADFHAVTGQAVLVVNKETGQLGVTQSSQVMEEPVTQNYKTFRVNKDQSNILDNNIRLYFTDHLYGTIKETMLDHITDTTSVLQRITQAQSIIMGDLFKKEVLAKLVEKKTNKEKYPDYSASDGLSENDIRDIWKKLLVYAPVVETESQNFMMSKGKVITDFGKVPVEIDGKTENIGMPNTYGTDMLTEKLATQPGHYGPGEANVSAIPLLTIGTGDALAMQVFFTRLAQKTMEVLSVYDGLNMAVNRIEEFSGLMNEAVAMALQENVLESVAANARLFMKNDIASILPEVSEDAREALSKVVQNRGTVETLNNDQEILSKLHELTDKMSDLAEEASIRQEVMNEVPFSLDQMASGETPYQNRGSEFGRKAFEGITMNSAFSEIARALNVVREHVIAKRAARSKTETDPKAEQTKRMWNAIQEESRQVKTLKDASGAVVMPAPDVVRVIKGHVPTDHWKALQLALKNHTMDGVKVVMGTRDEVSAYQLAHYPETVNTNEVRFKGKYDPINRVVYIADLNTETIAHELLHAMTTNKLALYYSNPGKLTSADRDSIQRIEALMDEFLEGSLDFKNRQQQMVFNQLDTKLSSMLMQGKRFQAVSEFISYVLTNQDLVDLARRSKVKNPLGKIIGEALQALKELIWGKVKTAETEIGKSFYQNLRFNVEVLASTNDLISTEISTLKDLMLYQDARFGNDSRLAYIRQQLQKSMTTLEAHARRMDDRAGAQTRIATEKVKSRTEWKKNVRQAEELAENLIANGFVMDMQQKSTFNYLVATLFSDMNVNRNSLSRMQDMYDHFIQNVTENDFMENPGHNDGSPEAIRDRTQAKIKFDALNGKLGSQIIKDDQSDLMAVFVGLAVVHPEMRTLLGKMSLPKNAPSEMVEGETRFDNWLTDWGTRAMDRLDNWVSGQGNSKQMNEVMDALVGSMLRNKLDQETYIEAESQRIFRKTENWLKRQVDDKSKKLTEASLKVADQSKNRAVKLAAGTISAVSGLLNEDIGTQSINNIISKVNQGSSFLPLRELMVQIVGRTSENKDVFDMINIVRKMVDQIRQKFRDELPQLIKEKFTKHVSPEMWNAARIALGMADLSAVMNVEGVERTLEYVADGRTRQGRIVELENQIKKLDPAFGDMVLEKSKQLAKFMVEQDSGHNLLRNAEAVARLLGEVSRTNMARKDVDLKELESLVDQHSSLKALSLVPAQELARVKVMVKLNPEGMSNLMKTMAGIRNDELSKPVSEDGRINRYKGYIKPQYQEGSDIIVAPLKDAPKLLLQGYQRAGKYVGSSLDINRGAMEYFYAPVSGLGHYNQGIIQNTGNTYSGVHPETGFSADRMAGRITGRAAQMIAMQRRKDTGGTEALRPVYNAKGALVGYERPLAPEQMAKRKAVTNFAEILGAWRGRQMEEAMAMVVNRKSIDALSEMWKVGQKEKRVNEFVDLAKISKDDDPILWEAFNLIPKHVKEQIYESYGSNTFMVRRDMLNTAVGGRSAMISDWWTGQSRLSPNVQEKLKNVVLGIFGAFGRETKAFTYAVGAQEFWQGVVSDAKQMIVIKSVIVPAVNLLSNIRHLLSMGVNVRQILVGLAKKTAETNDYMKRSRLEVQLDAELLAARGDKNEAEVIRISNRLQALRDSYRKLSIWPLIEAGEFSSISAGGISREEIALSEGRWGSIIEKLQEKVPESLQPLYRYAALTKDTPIFRALSLATQYGDFLAKAIAYDHLTQVMGKTQKEALGQVTEEFIHYNFYAGRVQGALEANGLAWFMTYKLRSIKVAERTLRNNPLRTMLLMSINPDLPIFVPTGSVVDDNAVTQLMDGSIFRAFGPGMVATAPELNPYYNAFY